jgi:hypothetical protein
MQKESLRVAFQGVQEKIDQRDVVGGWVGVGGSHLHPPDHGRMNYKDTKPYMSAFLSLGLLTEFAAFSLTDLIDWRNIHSWFVFSTQLVNSCPHGRRYYMVLVFCCPSTVPSL